VKERIYSLPVHRRRNQIEISGFKIDISKRWSFCV